MDSGRDSGLDTRGAGITVRRALELPGLLSGLPEILAGADRLHRTVRWVHAGEVPNIASLLKGGELLLTTGYGLGTRPAEQRAFVRTLADRGIAALVVELGPRFARLPAALVDTARTAGLPLVQLHREVPFVTVTEEIHTEIVNGHYALLQRAEEVDRRCTRALLDGGGVPQVLGILAGFGDNPVFLETPDGRLLYAAGSGPEGADPLQVWEGLRGPHKDAPPPAGSVLVDVPGGGPGTGAVRARLVLLPVRSPLAPVHRMAAERAAGTLAVVLMQARQEEELAARGRGDFLTDLAEGRVTADDAPAQARVLGFKPGTGPLLPVVMRLGDALSPSGGGWAVLARAVAEELTSVGVPALLGVRPVEGRVPLLLGLRSEAERPAVADRVAGAPARRSWSSAWRAAGRRPRRVCGTRRRRRRPHRAWPTGPGTTPGAWTSTCCCGGCATIRISRPSSTGRSARCATTTTVRSRPCCPPSRPTWRTPGARRKRPGSSTSTGRRSTTGWRGSANCWAPTSTTRRPSWP